ncbi:MAG: tetratricopeptide repeat protein [bacterium]|nr:tetratricopeptide repeat protein [bacterium]
MYEQAAQHGDIICQYLMGTYYEQGIGISVDYKKAFSYYKLAAQAGENRAKFRLGCLYVKGQGVGQDRQAAVKWIKQAANAGNGEALAWIRDRQRGMKTRYLPDPASFSAKLAYASSCESSAVSVTSYRDYHYGEGCLVYGIITDCRTETVKYPNGKPVITPSGETPLVTHIDISDGNSTLRNLVPQNAQHKEGDYSIQIGDVAIFAVLNQICTIYKLCGHVDYKTETYYEPPKIGGWEDLLK